MAQPETPDTRTRIRRHTPLHVDARIQQDIEANVRQYADRPGDISKHLDALDKEWNIERLVAATTSVLMLATIALAVAVDGRWLWLTVLFAVFLLQHAILGWSP